MNRGWISVVGVGSPFGDDRLGWEAAAALRRSPRLAPLIPHAIRIEVCDRPGLSLLPAWRGARKAMVIDAVRTGAAPGSFVRVPGDAIAAGRSGVSTHGFGVAEAVALARILGQLPADWVLLGLEIGARPAGDALSPALQAAMPEFLGRIEQELLADLEPPGGTAAGDARG